MPIRLEKIKKKTTIKSDMHSPGQWLKRLSSLILCFGEINWHNFKEGHLAKSIQITTIHTLWKCSYTYTCAKLCMCKVTHCSMVYEQKMKNDLKIRPKGAGEDMLLIYKWISYYIQKSRCANTFATNHMWLCEMWLVLIEMCLKW